MSITAYQVEAVGHDRTGRDFGYVNIMYRYSDHYLDARNPTPAETDFFTVTRLDAWGTSTWFMCTPEVAEKLIAMDYDNLSVRETTIVG